MPLKGAERFKQNLVARSGKLVRAVGLEAMGRLMRRTPVDTGRARANWNVSIGTPDRTATDAKNRSAASAKGALTIAQFRPGDVLYIVNGLPYIGSLEDGSSTQAPNGMVSVTAAEMSKLVGRVLAEVARG